MDFNDFVNQIANYLGLTAAQLLFYLGLAIVICNILGRLIPDDATGILGFVRKAAKVLGLYLANRIKAGVSVNDIARNVPGIVQHQVSAAIERRVIPHINQTVAETNPFKRDPATGQFLGRGDRPKKD